MAILTPLFVVKRSVDSMLVFVYASRASNAPFTAGSERERTVGTAKHENGFADAALVVDSVPLVFR